MPVVCPACGNQNLSDRQFCTRRLAICSSSLGLIGGLLFKWFRGRWRRFSE